MRDAVAVILWLAVNSLVFWSGWRLSCWLFPRERLAVRGQQVLVICWAEIVALAVLLGSCGWLSAVSLLSSAVLLACAVLGLVHHISRSMPTTEPDTTPQAGSWSHYLWSGLGCVLLALLLAWTIYEGLLRFPHDWDTLTYHLPLIVQWLHRGSLYAPAEANWANPGNNELIGLWCVALFSGDFLISLNNVPAIVLLGLSAVSLAEQLGLHPGWRHLCGLAVLAHYAIPDQAVTAGNDVAVAALFLTTLTYQLRYGQTGRRPDLFLSVLSLGLLTGIKYYALGYAGVAGISLLLLTWLTRGRRAAGWAFLSAWGAVLLWGGYWYLRNWLITGTPLYPKGLTENTDLMGRIRPDKWWQTSILGNERAEVYYLLLDAVWRLSGPIHWLAVVAFPVVQLWLLGSVMRQTRREEGWPTTWHRLVLAIWLPAAGLIWGLTPFSTTAAPGTLDMLIAGFSPVRYGVSFLSLAVLALGVVGQDLATGIGWLLASRRIGILILAILFMFVVGSQWCAGLFYQYPVRHEVLPHVALLAGDLLLAGSLLFLAWRAWPRLRWTLVMIVVLGLASGCYFLQQRWHKGFAPYYDQYFQDVFLKRYASAWNPAETRLCVLSYQYYPFFGSRRQFHAARPLWLPAYASLLEYLATHQITVVIAAPVQEGSNRYGRTAPWLENHPEIFHLEVQGTHWQAYRIQHQRLVEELSALSRPGETP